MSDSWAEDMKLAMQHAAADLMTKLEALQRGWTTLTHDDPMVQEAVDLAVQEAKTRGVPVDQIEAAGAQVLAAVSDVAASGQTPAEVATATKAPGGTPALGGTTDEPVSHVEPPPPNPDHAEPPPGPEA